MKNLRYSEVISKTELTFLSEDNKNNKMIIFKEITLSKTLNV